MSATTITVPAEIDFADLKLARDPYGVVSFDWTPIERICTISNIDVNLLRDSLEDNLAGLIVAWYDEHQQRGGAADLVADDLITEAIAELKFGNGLSHKPGLA